MTERDFVQWITTQNPAVRDPKIIHGIGDDAAVIDRGEKYELLTTDTITEGDHFRLDRSTPEQIGVRALVDNVSDIIAMGGVPRYALISLMMPKRRAQWFLEGFYKGFFKLAGELDIALIGGDLVEADSILVNMTLAGEVEKDRLCLRSTAQTGDLIGVTGDLGTAVTGFASLQKHGLEAKDLEIYARVVDLYLNPTLRVKESRILSLYVSAMTDLSDGLGTDLREICRASQCSAVVEGEKLPIHDDVKRIAEELAIEPSHLALTGGEDYELLFTISPEKLGQLRTDHPDLKIHIIGEILEGTEDISMLEKGEKRPIPRGFEHFVGLRYNLT